MSVFYIDSSATHRNHHFHIQSVRNEKKYIFDEKKSRLASDDCIVGEYGEWGECAGATCGGTGKQYRQRSYKYPDKATKCHRKLFDTKTCTMPRCSHGTNDYFMHVHQTMHLTLLWNNLFPKLFFSKYLIIYWWLLSSLKNGTSTENNRRFGFKSLLVFFKKLLVFLISIHIFLF